MSTASLVLPLMLASAASAATLPPAPAKAFTEERHGHRIDDPYRWMEDPAQAAELQAWMKQAGEATRAKLEALPERAAFKAALDAATRSGVAYSDAQSAGGRLFFLRRDPDAAVPKLVVRDRDGADRVLVDPGADAAAGTGGARAVASFTPSPDGALVAVLVGEGGGELGRFAILDVASGRERWRLDGTTFGDFELSWLAADLLAYTRGTHEAGSGRDPLLDTQSMVVKLTPAGPVERVGLGSQLKDGPAFEPQEFPAIFARGRSGLVLGLGLGARADARLMVTTVDALRAGTPRWQVMAGYDTRWSTATSRATTSTTSAPAKRPPAPSTAAACSPTASGRSSRWCRPTA